MMKKSLLISIFLLCIPAWASCPKGTAYADGCPAAPTGTAQYPSMLDGYAVRPPWNVAGVDYYVGIPTGTTFTDWRSISDPKVSLDLGNGLIKCGQAGANVTLNAIDFSLGSGSTAVIYDPNGICASWTITSSKLGPCTGHSGINYTMADAQNVTFKNNKFDGTGCTTQSSFLTTGGTQVIQYNWFSKAYQHILETGTGANIDYRFNLVDDSVPGGAGTGQHENWQQLTGTGTVNADNVSYNTSYQHASGSGNGEGYQFYCNAGPCNLTSPAVTHNTVVALGGTNMSYVVNGGDNSHPVGTITNASNAYNFFVAAGAFGAYYPGTITSAKGWTSSCNLNMTNGKLINPADNSESTATGCDTGRSGGSTLAPPSGLVVVVN